jgi:hypothetical protein
LRTRVSTIQFFKIYSFARPRPGLLSYRLELPETATQAWEGEREFYT